MFIDSHCHLNFPELSTNIEYYLNEMQNNKVKYALCVGTRLDNLDPIVAIATRHDHIFASVGVHPDERMENLVLTADDLLKYTNNPKVIAIGETGLDYYRTQGEDMTWQQQRFILHIEVAKSVNLPLIIHTREAIDDTINLLQENDAMSCGAVMHCFTENLHQAKRCLDLGFYISISGIVTFKNAATVQEMAKYVPLDRLLIETDAPFLAPMPFRGKTNHPALVKYTAQYLADLKNISVEQLAQITSTNFFKLFTKAAKYI
jgi:TatD DNase family protein